MRKKLEAIQSEFYRLRQNEQIVILWDALDIMSLYNGRSRWECVAQAMGYENENGFYTKGNPA